MYIKALSKREFINSLKNKGVTDENVEEYGSTYLSLNQMMNLILYCQH